jgi:hypothetical protein
VKSAAVETIQSLHDDNLTLAILTDGRRERIEKCYQSWIDNLDISLFKHKIIFDSSGDPNYSSYLKQTYDMNVVSFESKLNLPNAFGKMFTYLSKIDSTYTFFLEDDFYIPNPIDIYRLLDILKHADLEQISLIRQPWYPKEFEFDGLMRKLQPELHLVEKRHGDWVWQEHNVSWTNNPSLINNRVFAIPYPEEHLHCETNFARRIVGQWPHAKLGYYGSYDDQPMVIHTGK